MAAPTRTRLNRHPMIQEANAVAAIRGEEHILVVVVAEDSHRLVVALVVLAAVVAAPWQRKEVLLLAAADIDAAVVTCCRRILVIDRLLPIAVEINQQNKRVAAQLVLFEDIDLSFDDDNNFSCLCCRRI